MVFINPKWIDTAVFCETLKKKRSFRIPQNIGKLWLSCSKIEHILSWYIFLKLSNPIFKSKVNKVKLGPSKQPGQNGIFQVSSHMLLSGQRMQEGEGHYAAPGGHVLSPLPHLRLFAIFPFQFGAGLSRFIIVLHPISIGSSNIYVVPLFSDCLCVLRFLKFLAF